MCHLKIETYVANYFTFQVKETNVGWPQQSNSWIALSRNPDGIKKNIFENHSVDKVKKLWYHRRLIKITLLSNFQVCGFSQTSLIFLGIFWTNLQSPGWNHIFKIYLPLTLYFLMPLYTIFIAFVLKGQNVVSWLQGWQVEGIKNLDKAMCFYTVLFSNLD